MQLVQFVHQGATRCGYLDGDEIVGVDWSLRDALVLLTAGQPERIAEAVPGA
ncbi:hypothetical protein H7I76_01540 [Mycolicibacterium vaccae]|nr:hypothetical protein [Mycolicibacterium vaccae]